MEFNRRDFIKGTLALGSIAAVGGLAGCSSPQNQSPDSSPLADTGSIPGIPESFTDGKWIGTAMGHDDELRRGRRRRRRPRLSSRPALR